MREPGWVLDAALHHAGNGKVFAAYLHSASAHEIAELRLGKKTEQFYADAEKLHKQVDRYAYSSPQPNSPNWRSTTRSRSSCSWHAKEIPALTALRPDGWGACWRSARSDLQMLVSRSHSSSGCLTGVETLRAFARRR
jgi:hypothetical protein